MEDTVSVLIWEEAMDMTDWARLLLAGSVDTEVRAGDRRMITKEQYALPILGHKEGYECLHSSWERFRLKVFQDSALKLKD